MTIKQVASRAREVVTKPSVTRPSRLVFYDDSFVFDRVSGHFYRLNGTAAFVLRSIGDGLDQTELPEALQSHFNIDHETAVRDAELFLNELSMLDLLMDEKG